MCIKPYYGWLCGHADLSATELPVVPCESPDRLPHEPFCSPQTPELIIRKFPEYDKEVEDDAQKNREMEYCTTCCEIRARIDQQWSTKRAELLEAGAATERDLQSIDARLSDHKHPVLAIGIESGPDHTAHLEYEPGQNTILRDMDDMLMELEDIKDSFRDNIHLIDSTGLVSESTIKEYIRRYDRLERRRMALDELQIEQFRNSVLRCIEGLFKAQALAVRRSIGADPQSGEA